MELPTIFCLKSQYYRLHTNFKIKGLDLKFDAKSEKKSTFVTVFLFHTGNHVHDTGNGLYDIIIGIGLLLQKNVCFLYWGSFGGF